MELSCGIFIEKKRMSQVTWPDEFDMFICLFTAANTVKVHQIMREATAVGSFSNNYRNNFKVASTGKVFDGCAAQDC